MSKITTIEPRSPMESQSIIDLFRDTDEWSGVALIGFRIAIIEQVLIESKLVTYAQLHHELANRCLQTERK